MPLNNGGGFQNLGVRPSSILRVAANVASAETVTVDGEVYEISIVNTSMAKTTSCNNTSNPVSLTITAHGFVAGNVGDLIRVDSEIMKIVSVTDVDTIVCSRAHSATSIATHTGATVYKAAAPATAGRKEVGLVATLTPTVFGDAFVAVFNSETALSGVTCYKAATSFDIVFSKAVAVAYTGAVSEGLAGANNVFLDTAFSGGLAPTMKSFSIASRVPTANEVTAGRMYFAFPFVPSFVAITVRSTSAGTQKNWDGALTIDATNKVVLIDNAGAVDWAATDTVTLLAI